MTSIPATVDDASEEGNFRGFQISSTFVIGVVEINVNLLDSGVYRCMSESTREVRDAGESTANQEQLDERVSSTTGVSVGESVDQLAGHSFYTKAEKEIIEYI